MYRAMNALYKNGYTSVCCSDVAGAPRKKDGRLPRTYVGLRPTLAVAAHGPASGLLRKKTRYRIEKTQSQKNVEL